MPRIRAMSPAMRGWMLSVPTGVERNKAMLSISCGTMVLLDAASIKGLICTI